MGRKSLLLAELFVLCAGLEALAARYLNAATSVSIFGSVATNSEYAAIPCWQQQHAAGVSLAGEYVNY